MTIHAMQSCHIRYSITHVKEIERDRVGRWNEGREEEMGGERARRGNE